MYSLFLPPYSGYVGNFEKIEMSSDETASYSAMIPPFEAGEYVRYYVEAVASNTAGTATYSPVGAEHDVYLYHVSTSDEVVSDLVINELMASNKTTVMDENGDSEDWVELYNNGRESISLDGYYLTDDATELTKWAFPSVTVAADAYLTIWTDNDEEDGDLHTNFKLSASGEELLLITPELEIADQVFFTNQYEDISYGRSPNGIGDFSLLSPTYGTNNDQTTGVSAVATFDFELYPNPVANFLYLQGEALIVDLGVYSLTGQAVKTGCDGGNRLDVSALSSGVCFLRIETSESQQCLRFVKR